ncbi:MAG: hypothetical protein WCN27_01560 [Alphaproteobacteria bacterium]
MLLSNIIFVLIFMATASSAEHYHTRKKEQQEDGRVLGTFETKEQFEPFAVETVTTTVIAADGLFEKLRRQYPYPKIPNSERPEFLGERGIFSRGEIRKNDEDKFLHISGLDDSVGVVLRGTEYSGAYHVSSMDLRNFCPPQELNKNGNFAKWLDEYKGKEINFSKAQVFIASSFWTKNVEDVLYLLAHNGFNAHYMSIPDLELSFSGDANREVFIRQDSPYLERVLALKGHRIPLLTQLAVDTQTGAAWCEHFLRG